jgi:hypothetical protein
VKYLVGLLVSAVVFFGCAPVPTDLLPDRPVAGQACDPTENRSVLTHASCDGCVNSRLTCTQGRLWVCLPPVQGELCERISNDAGGPPLASDAAVPLDAVTATDAASADVSTTPTDRPNPPSSDAGPRIVGGVCTNGLGRCSRTGMWVQVRPGVLECSTGNLGARDQFETCDETGVDENCNGLVNEDCQCVAGQTRWCYTGSSNAWGVGICVRGTQVCDPRGRWSTSCMGEVLPRISDICNNQLDDDCNGLIDETPCPPSPR